MKFLFTLLASLIIFLFSDCSRKPSGAGSPQRFEDIPPPSVGVDQCLFQGQVVSTIDGISEIRVEKVIDKGSAFIGPLYSGEIIKLAEVSAGKGIRTFLVESSDGPDGLELRLIEQKN